MKKRIIAFILAVVTMFSILTVSAGAVSPQSGDTPSTIKMDDCTHNGVKYESPALGTCHLHQMHFGLNGKSTMGFCAEKGKGMGWSLEGQTWGKPKAVNDPTVSTMMAYFYAHSTGVFTDQAKALGVDDVWDSSYTWTMNAWVQAVVWRYKAGLLSDPVVACAEELMCVYNNLEHTSYTSIDDTMDGRSFRDRAQYILDLGAQGVWGECAVYEYAYTGSSTSYHPANDVQAIMIGELTVTRELYDLIIKKVDSTNPNKGLSGARFKVTSENGSYSKEVVTGSDGTVTISKLEANTYAVVELEAPEGYEIDNAGPQYVVLPNGTNKTVTVTFFDTPTITGEGSIRKVDADDPTRGLAGAVIKITGVDNDFTGTYVTGAGGYLTDVPWKDMPLGSFTAEEVTPPENYTKSPDVNKTKQTFVWDGKTDVALVFENDAKVKVRLMKLDDSGNPLPGAVFNIVKDGQIIGTEETKSDGSITVTDVTEGMYAFVEVSVPAPWATLTEPVIAHVDQATVNGGGTVTVTASDKKLPNLTILKRDSQSGDVIPETHFEIRGIHYGYHNDVTTGPDGKATLTALPVDSYEVTEKSVPAPWVVGDEPAQTIWLGAGDSKELVFDNLKQPLLKIAKVEQGTNPAVYVPNTNFLIEGIDSDYRHDVTTGPDGTVELRVAPGSYKITERSVPEPYYISDTPSQIVSLNPGNEKEVRFENQKKPLLTLKKIDADSQKPIPNTVLTVKALDGTYQDDWTTGADGTVSLRVNPGVYEVTEKSVPSPYYLPDKDADRTQTITLSPGDEKTLVFRNRKAPEITIFKENSITGEPIEHAKFHIVYTSNGEAAEAPATIDYGEVFTDSRGEIKVHALGKRLYPGEFTITEVAPADGFQLKEPLTQTVIIHGNESKTVRFQNTPLSALVVWKYDSVTSAPVEGAIFQVKYMSGTSGTGGTVIGTYKTGPSGSFAVNRLKAGAYLVEELASDGDHVMDTAPQTAYISGNEQDVVQLYFGNSPKGSLLLKKIDTSTHEPLSDCEFFITDSHGTMLGDANGKFVTDSAGTILISNIDPGTTVVARETRAKPNYILDDVPQTATIKAGQTVSLEFRNQPKGSVTLYKFSSLDRRTPLEGVGFKITFANGQVVDNIGGKLSSNGIYYTDSEGQINISGVTGTLVFTEISSIPGYLIDENRKSQTIVVNPDDHQSVYFYNQPVGNLVIKKMSSTTKEPLSDVVIRVTRTDGTVVGESNGEFRTDEAGFIKIPVEPGSYIVQEVKSKPGFLLDDTPKTIEVKGPGTYNIELFNQPLGSLVIHKYSSLDRKTPLAGVQFKVAYAPGCVVDDENGKISSKGRFKTNDAGEIRVPVVGTVVVKEIKSLPTHVIDTATQIQTVQVNPADTQYITVYNEPLCSLTLRKLDAVTGKPVPNTEFTLKDGNGTVLGRYTTGADGTVTVTGLIPNSTVVVVESKVPANYVLDPTPRTIIVRNGSNSVASGGGNTSGGTAVGGNTGTGSGNTGTVGGGNDLTVENMPKTTLTVEKYLETDSGNVPLKGVVFLITDSSGTILGPNNGEYTTDENGRIVLPNLEPGTVITAKEIRVPDGVVLDPTPKSIEIKGGIGGQTLTFVNKSAGGLELIKVNEADKSQRIPNTTFEIRKMDGALVDTVTTDKQGRAHLDLDAGDYYAVEIEAGKGFRLDATPIYFTIRDGKSTTVTVTNRAVSGILIHKVDSATKQGIYGVSFLLYDASKNPIGQYSSDDKGYVYIDDLPGSGRYYLRELENDGYLVDTQLKTVYVTDGTTTEITWENTAITGQIQITKTSEDYNSMNGWPAGTPIPGTEFEIYHYRTGNLVDTVRTDKNGVAVSKPLPLGRYKVVESKAAEFYGLDKTPIEVEIEHAGQIVKTAMTNKALYTNVSIKKTGFVEVMPGQQLRYDFSGIANNSTTALTSFYWRDTLPVQAVRLDKIVTGTYNVQGNYKIVFKTNLSGEYRTMYDNLSTMQNHVLDASPAALGLASNEYVTEFMVSFGIVPGNFRQVEAPKVYCNVVSWLTGGTQFANQADAGGVYNGQWIMATSRWVTRVYKPAKPLPRTGY